MFPFARSLCLAALAGCAAAALPVIERKGSFLFDSSSGDRFYLKGVAYAANFGSGQDAGPSGSITALDPLANGPGCTRDIPFFKQLGLNTIRVYQVNSSLDHSACMSALDAAGIYVVLDLATPAANAAISSDAPSWNVGLLSNFLATVDAFAGFSNVIGFNVGNEVISSLPDDSSAPFIKAAVRDVKAHIKSRNFTQLVGYTATDSPNSRVTLPFFLACEDTSSSIDYWGLNIYEWCGVSDFVTSGYQARTQELAGLGIPAFFSEFGCNTVEPRQFQDIPTLYSSNMTGVWSGGIIFEYFEASNNFGLGTLSADGSTFTPNADFNTLKTQFNAVNGPSLSANSYTPTVSEPVACPTSDASWPVSTALPPTPNSAVCNCVVGNLSCRTPLTDTELSQVGTALGTVCGQPGAAAGCAAIAGNGTTGVYGALSFCDPVQALDVALDTYFEGQARAASACDFGGVATLASGGPTASGAVAAATSTCLAAGFSGGTGVPLGTLTPSGAFTSGAAGASGVVGANSGAVALRVVLLPWAVVGVLIGVGAVMVFGA